MELTGDNSSLILTVHANGEDGSWIGYDKEQLYDLICKLIHHYGKMKPGGRTLQ